MDTPKVAIIIIDSRSKIHPDWVRLAVDSANSQMLPCSVVVVDNTKREKTIGKCWNDAVKTIDAEYVMFLGDDDWLSKDYVASLLSYAFIHPNHVSYTTYMTAYSEENHLYAPLQRQCTGMWRREYLLKYPFNEKLKTGIDREYVEETVKRNDTILLISHNYGYFYRKHNDYSCSGDITFVCEPKDIYVLASNRTFIDPIFDKLNFPSVGIYGGEFNAELASNAKTIFCDWLTPEALKAGDFSCDAKKILRIHSAEVFSTIIDYVDFSCFDHVIFVSSAIRDYVETRLGKIDNAIVIPNGIDLEKFNIPKGKKKNNKIAYAGYLTRKKGIGELMIVAQEFPEYQFHLAGKYQENDIAWALQHNLPDNVTIHPWQYDLNKFYSDKTYVINTSMREAHPVAVWEAMAAGLTPLVRMWPGAMSQFGINNTWESMSDIRGILKEPSEPKVMRFIAEQYDINKIAKKIGDLL